MEGSADTHKPRNKEHRADKRGHKAPCDRFIPISVWFPSLSWQSHNALLYPKSFANKHYVFGLCVSAGPSVTSGRIIAGWSSLAAVSGLIAVGVTSWALRD